MKKQLPLLLLTALIGAFVFSLEGCHDKCEGSIKTSAEFKTYNELYYFDKEDGKTVEKTKIVEEDTFMLGSVTFEALEQNAESYEWTIGTDPKKRTEKKFSLTFDNPNVISENPLIIKLKIKKAPNSQCFPTDNGVDSIKHQIYFLPESIRPIYGKYKGFDDSDQSKTFIIEIYKDKIGDTFIGNLPNSCNTIGKDVRFSYSTAFEFTLDIIPNTDLTCYFIRYDKNIGYLLPNRKDIVIDYQFTEGGVDDTQKKHRIFKGKKI